MRVGSLLVLVLVLQGQPASSAKEILMWAWFCPYTPSTYLSASFADNLIDLHDRGDITEVSWLAYDLDLDGTFGYFAHGEENSDGQSCGAVNENGISYIVSKRPALPQYPLLGVHPDGNISTVEIMILNETKRAAFIDTAVNKMLELGFHGYNVDMEVGEGSSNWFTATAYLDFIDAFADAVHAHGGKLSADIIWCGNGSAPSPNTIGYMGMRCSMYRRSKADHVVIMNTYMPHGPSQAWFTDNIDGALHPDYGLGEDLLVVGMDLYNWGNSSADQIAVYFDQLTARRIEKVALWHCGYPGCLDRSYAFPEALHAWMRSSLAPTPVGTPPPPPHRASTKEVFSRETGVAVLVAASLAVGVPALVVLYRQRNGDGGSSYQPVDTV